MRLTDRTRRASAAARGGSTLRSRKGVRSSTRSSGSPRRYASSRSAYTVTSGSSGTRAPDGGSGVNGEAEPLGEPPEGAGVAERLTVAETGDGRVQPSQAAERLAVPLPVDGPHGYRLLQAVAARERMAVHGDVA